MSQCSSTRESGSQNQVDTEGNASIVAEDSSDLHNKPQQCHHDAVGHREFLPVVGLSVHHLPPELQDEELLRMIHSIADLTVKIDASQQSGDTLKREAGAEAKIPCHTERGATGSGFICSFTKQDKGSDCPCARCQESGAPRKKLWATVEIATASSVVGDDSQARHAKVILDLSSCSSGASWFSLEGFKVIERNGENSFALLECVTCDTLLIGKLEKCILTFESQRVAVYRKFMGKYRDLRSNILKVSHPHGSSKHVSFGCLKAVLYSSAWSKLVHTAPACPGCEGAFVYFVGCSGGVWPYPHVQVQRLASGSSSTGYGIIAKKL